MSTEQNQPEAQGAPEPVANDGGSEVRGTDNQSQRAPGAAGRFRRRRRRRKPGAQPPVAGQAGQSPNGATAIAASADAPASDGGEDGERSQRPQQSSQQNSQPGAPQNQNQAADGRRRRKKKGGRKFASGGQQTHQPGNRQSNQPGNTFGQAGRSSSGGRRQKKGRGSRAFVGPMDHSYRATNGNYSEAPPSTIQVNGNHGSGRAHARNNAMHDTGHQSQFLPTHYEPKPPVIADDAPVKVYCFIDDLFVTAKITEAARKLGVKIAFVKAEKDDLAAIYDVPEEQRAHLILFDLNNASAKPMTLIPKIRTKLKKTVSIIGYVGQIQGDLKAKAIEAGCDSVMPRAAFSQALPGLLRRYGLEEDTESQDSQHAYF